MSELSRVGECTDKLMDRQDALDRCATPEAQLQVIQEIDVVCPAECPGTVTKPLIKIFGKTIMSAAQCGLTEQRAAQCRQLNSIPVLPHTAGDNPLQTS